MWGVVDVDEPFRGPQEFQAVDEVNLETLVSFGFKPDVACKALRATVGMTISIFMLLWGDAIVLLQMCFSSHVLIQSMFTILFLGWECGEGRGVDF